MMANGLLKRSLEVEIDDIQKLVDYIKEDIENDEYESFLKEVKK